jgi:hypothetical protein
MSVFLNIGNRQLTLDELNVAADETGKAQITMSDDDKRPAGTVTLPNGQRMVLVQKKRGDKR